MTILLHRTLMSQIFSTILLKDCRIMRLSPTMEIIRRTENLASRQVSFCMMSVMKILQFTAKSTICPKTGKMRSEEHTSELQSRFDLVCRLLLEKKKNNRV